MLGLLPKPAAILEERGPDWFRPARPQPYQEPFGPFARLLAARRNLISVFTENDYVSRNGMLRVLGRQVVIVNEPAAVKHVMVTNNDNFERKSPQLRRALEHLAGDGLFVSDGEIWARRRPLVVDIMHRNRMPVFGRSMEAAVADMADRWRQRAPGTTFNALADMAELTAEIIAQAVFGQKLGPRAAHNVVDAFSRYQRLIDSVNVGYFLGADEGWPIVRGPRLRRELARIHAVIDRVITDHIAAAGDGPGDETSMVALLVRRQARNPDLDLGALRSEAATMFMAGHEGTTATLTWAWYLLDNAPWVEDAMLAEIATVVGDRAPTVADVPKLDWCRAVIEETLRLYPSIPIMARQARAADRVGDIDVEPAALVMVVPWLLHRATDLWERPSDFLPERFLGGQRPAPYTYLPFSAGPRVCPGASFGQTEAVLCLATLAQRFKVRVAPGHRVEPHCRLSLRPRGGLPVIAEPRS